MKNKTLLLLLLMALFAPLAMHAQNTLTVCDGTETNEYIPVYGYYADYDGATSEFILPSTTEGLSNMIGAEITGMTFYISSPAEKAYGSTFEVYMTEVDYTTQTSSWTGEGTVVYTGELDGTGTIMEIEFDDVYVYLGGNLLIGTLVTDGDDYAHTFFYGIEAESGASINVYPSGSQYYGGARAFLPKTTFTYVVPDCPMPTLALDYTEGDTEATVSWTSDATSFNVMVNGESVAEGISQASYTFAVEPATTYTVEVQADCGDTQSRWASTSFFSGCPETFAIPYADGFEDANTINCWTIVAGDNYTGVQNNDFSQTNMGYNAARTGDNYFFFLFTQNPPSYLISPELSGIENGLHVEFYYRQDENGVETFHVGYSTGGNDPENDFIWGDEITASESYQRFSANYPAETKYIAVKLTSNYQYYLYLDDFLFEEKPNCIEPSNVEVSDITTESATVSWAYEILGRTKYGIYVTTDATDVPDDTTTPTYDNVSTKSQELTDLQPATTYYVYVRANCSETSISAWSSPAIFNTECEDLALPYTEDFAEGMSVCWTTINTNTSYNTIGVMALSETTNVLSFHIASSSGDLIAVLPKVDENYPLNEYQISFYACYANTSSTSMTSGALSIGVMTDPNDASTFEEVKALTISDAYSSFGYYLVRLNEYEGTGQYLAIKNDYTGAGYVLVGNIEVTELPVCFEPTNLDVDHDGLTALVTWEGEGESFDIAFTTDPNDDPDDVIIDTTTDNEYDLSEYTQPGDNYVYVRTNCGETDGYSEWVGSYFNVTYCAPYITQHDGYGITGVSFGTGDDVVNQSNTSGIPSSAPYYGDYSDMIGAVQAGVESTIAITTSTDNYPYTFVIWADLDNSMTFDDEEILYVGKASEGNGTLNATITIPVDQPLGDYRMRIFGADSYFEDFYNGSEIDWDGDHDPCGNPSWAHVCDFTLRVLEAPSCLPPTNLAASFTELEGGELQALLTWSANDNENGWTLYWKENDDDEYQDEDLEDNSYTLTVAPQATYEFYVVADCGIDGESDPSMVYEFTAPCLSIIVDADNPFFEGFEDETWPPDCWTSIASGSNAWDINDDEDYIYTGTGSAYSGYDGDIYLVMPTIQLGTDGDQAQLSFWTINRWPEDFEEGNNAVVLLDGNTETELWVPSEVTEEWEQVIIDLTAYMGQTITIAFKYAGDWGNAYYIDDVEVSVTTTASGQTIELSEGWNWVSIYVEGDPVDLLDQLKESLGDNATEIQSYDYTTEYEGDGEWFGDLDEEGIEPTQMFMINVVNACSFLLEGEPVVTEEYEITINPGWNWIGFPSNVAVEVNEALADFEAEEGDEIQSKDYATEFDGDEWFGDLEEFQPGEGLMYFSNSSEPKTLTFVIGAKKRH